jgi:hypothetical protein
MWVGKRREGFLLREIEVSPPSLFKEMRGVGQYGISPLRKNENTF